MKKFKPHNIFHSKKMLLGILGFAAIGSAIILLTRAAAIYPVIEPALATVSSGAISSNDATAPYIQFNAPSTACPVGQTGTPPNCLTPATGLFLDGFFPIGVDVQPTSNFSLWKSRGINTLIRVPQGNDVNSWAIAANQAGLKQIREPRTNPADDKNDPTLMAWMHQDEPDGIYSQIPYTTLQNDYNRWKGIDPNRTVLINFIGHMNQYDTRTGEGGIPWYQKYMAAADWMSGDVYPVNGQEPTSEIGAMLDRLDSWSGGKPKFAYIESADFDPASGGPAPTPDQVRSQVWYAIIKGARGIWYFPVNLNPFQFDATPANVAAEMVTLHAKINSLAPVLQGPINPVGISASAPAPMEVAWRSDLSGKYFIVLNPSNAARSNQVITLNGIASTASASVFQEGRSVSIVSGKITDNFGAYSVHIYQVQ